MKHVLVITTWWPNKFEPEKGIFSKTITESLLKYFNYSVTVISPIPYFPNFNVGFIPEKFRNYARLDYKEEQDRYNVFRPKYYKLPYPFSKKFDWISYYKSVLSVIKKENIQFDIVHSHGLFPDSYAAYKVSIKLGKPLIVHLHDSYISEVYIENLNKIDKIFEYASKLLPVSYFQADCVKKIIKNELLHTKICVVYNGIDNLFFDSPLNSTVKNNRIVFVGGIIETKGISILLHAVKKLSETTLFSLDLYGNGNIDYFSAMSKKLSVNKFVTFKGGIDNSTLPSVLKEYSIFVLPSFYETFGIVLIEALACGLPVVSSNIAAISEIVQQDVNGLLVAPGDAELLCNALKNACEREWDHSLIRRSVDKFKVLNTVRTIETVYNEVFLIKHKAEFVK